MEGLATFVFPAGENQQPFIISVKLEPELLEVAGLKDLKVLAMDSMKKYISSLEISYKFKEVKKEEAKVEEVKE